MQAQFQLCCFIHSWFLYFSKYVGSRSRKGSCFTAMGGSGHEQEPSTNLESLLQ